MLVLAEPYFVNCIEANGFLPDFDAVINILKSIMNVTRPDASFYLWPETPVSDTEFAAGLYSSQNITVLLGSYLSRSIAAGNPGKNRIRIVLVAEIEQCIEAAERICQYIGTTYHA